MELDTNRILIQITGRDKTAMTMAEDLKNICNAETKTFYETAHLNGFTISMSRTDFEYLLTKIRKR